MTDPVSVVLHPIYFKVLCVRNKVTRLPNCQDLALY